MRRQRPTSVVNPISQQDNFNDVVNDTGMISTLYDGGDVDSWMYVTDPCESYLPLVYKNVSNAIVRLESRLLNDTFVKPYKSILWTQSYETLSCVMDPLSASVPDTFIRVLDTLSKALEVGGVRDDIVVSHYVMDAYFRMCMDSDKHIDQTYDSSRYTEWGNRLALHTIRLTNTSRRRLRLVCQFNDILTYVEDVARRRGLIIVCIFLNTCLCIAFNEACSNGENDECAPPVT
jgi:hypothetical protein